MSAPVQHILRECTIILGRLLKIVIVRGVGGVPDFLLLIGILIFQNPRKTFENIPLSAQKCHIAGAWGVPYFFC